MFPLLPFIAGIATGVAVVKLMRSDSTRDGLGKAKEKIRQATVSSLAAIEHSSAAMRERLSGSASEPAVVSPPTTVDGASVPTEPTDKEMN